MVITSVHHLSDVPFTSTVIKDLNECPVYRVNNSQCMVSYYVVCLVS